ncbi:DUF4870 domain-containing protein [Natranaerobius trueperi]|uniref:DUF4870 domain-containing protein n=1 Tax=Natranaerobius trueperi TaxID=759412 RepID=UPI0013034B65|nr:DUF4870 domain-containing protein [Natranaerobius trueperi]
MSLKSDDKIFAGLSHLAIFLDFIGTIATLMIYITKKDYSKFIEYHAKQALGYQVVILLISWAINLVFIGGAIGGFLGTGFIMGQGLLSIIPMVSLVGIRVVISLMIYGYAIFASLQAFQGEEFKYIVIGDFIDRL